MAKESADVVILDDNFATIVVVSKWGRSVYSNIQKFVQFQLTVNLVALVINFSSACITGNDLFALLQVLSQPLYIRAPNLKLEKGTEALCVFASSGFQASLFLINGCGLYTSS